MKNIKWIFFDLGYTLINEDKVHDKRILDAITEMEKYGTKITAEEFMKGMINESKSYAASPFYAFIKNLGFNFKIPYISELEMVYEASITVLKELHKKYKIGIIANQALGTVKRLEKYGLMEYIDLCCSSAEKGVAKPDLQFFELALGEAAISADYACMVGDRLDNDILPAKKIGMKTIRILQGFGAYQEPLSDEYEPDLTINNLTELIGVFE